MASAKPRKAPLYTAKIIRVGAVLPDTKVMLTHWNLAASVSANLERMRTENIFAKASRSRILVMLETFRQRYLTNPDVLPALGHAGLGGASDSLLDLILYVLVRAGSARRSAPARCGARSAVSDARARADDRRMWRAGSMRRWRRAGRNNNLLVDSFVPLIAKAGVPPIRFHDLRHSCATILLMQGVNPKVVSEMLGHALVAIALDLYSHVLPDMQAQAARAMEAALWG